MRVRVRVRVRTCSLGTPPQLGSCASSGRVSRLWAARHAQEEADPLDAQPRPQVLEPAAAKAAADVTAFDPAGMAIKLRRNEKRILLRTIRVCEAALQTEDRMNSVV